MTSRKRKSTTQSANLQPTHPTSVPRARKSDSSRKKRRRHLLESLESRQLLAGPQLIGVQPNEGDLIIDGSVRDVAPRVLTLRFDEDQIISQASLDAIRITRSGPDGVFGSAADDDVVIEPGLIVVNDVKQNEVEIRFSDALPDDNYRLEVFGFDDTGLGIVGLRNTGGELLMPRQAGRRSEVINFKLALGALVESVVPQPVIRNEDGSLSQNRNEVVVYFNEDPLFVEDDSAGGVLTVPNGQITVTASLTAPSFTNTKVLFQTGAAGTNTVAVLDAAANAITVTRPATGTIGQVATAINSLTNFQASVTAGNSNAVFVPPGANSTFVIKGNPTLRSAENPRFYQLFFTQETVRTTDDLLFDPEEVVYDAATHTARLIFADDINNLPGVPLEGGTWRLRIGTAVGDGVTPIQNNQMEIILEPEPFAVRATAVTDFQQAGLQVRFAEKQIGENSSGRVIRFEDSSAGGVTARVDISGAIVFDFGGTAPEVIDLESAILANAAVDALIEIDWELNGVRRAGGNLPLPQSVIGSTGLVLQAAGDTLTTSLDIGIFGRDEAITSLILTESIDPQPFAIELPGGNDDPGHRELPEGIGGLLQHVNVDFGADSVNGVTEIPYNFQSIFDTSGPNSFLNQITQRQRLRIREALDLWASEIGVQFRETEDLGITFAVGDTATLQFMPGTTRASIPQLNATVRIDPTFTESAIVFSNQTDFGTAYGEDFTRKAVAGIGFLLGLEQAQDLPAQTVMALNGGFLNAGIDQLTGLEPVFPGNHDVLHGQYLHRPDSLDVDLYRFEVNLQDVDRVGTFTAETFAERLPDASSLDTTLTLFQEKSAFAETDFETGPDLALRFTSLLKGALGNNTRIDFLQSDRVAGDNAIRINRVFDANGDPIANALLIDIPRISGTITSVPAQDVVDAINADPFASSIMRAAVTFGNGATNISGATQPQPIIFRGGGLEMISRNDDYFSEDSRIVATLGEGVYYVGVAASGNDTYDPTLTQSGFGGRTQGKYGLQIKFEPQVDEVDVIRDLDSGRQDLPGTRLDGDGDGVPGGEHNFWFQTRPLNRILNFTDNGEAITPGQKLEVVAGTDVAGNPIIRTYELVPDGGTPTAGTVPVFYSDGTLGFPTPAGNIAAALQAAINSRSGETGVVVSRSLTGLIFTGERSIELSADWRGATAIGRNIFVDKTAGPNADGSLARPFNNIASTTVASAFNSTLDGDIVRIVGNGGLDGDLTTQEDNFSYKIGFADVGGQTLEDGRVMEVPKGVTTMIDAGAILKLRGSYIMVGSSTLQVDRSGGALQILGTPRLVGLSHSNQPVETTLVGNADNTIASYDDGSVIITSIRDRVADTAAAGTGNNAAAGDWGGIIYRRELDQFEGRRDLEDEGIFLQRINHAEIRYGGSSNVLIDSVQQLVNPIQIINMRPTLTFNEITQSADAAISASPDSFEETSYQSPRFQQAGAFTADYDRVGPDISNNLFLENSVNGLFIRISTTSTETPKKLTVAGRFDDIGVVHYLPENLVVAGQSGGTITDSFAPSLGLVSARELSGGTFQPGTYTYKLTFVDKDGFESLATPDNVPNQPATSFSFTVANANSTIEMTGLPLVELGGQYVSRRLYRADAGPNPVYRLVADLDASSAGFIDDGTISDGVLDLTRQGTRGRLDASLIVDPGLVMKLSGSRIELEPGTVMLAEGLTSNPVIFTSIQDDNYGAGGTFDTNNNFVDGAAREGSAGDWAGIYAGPTSTISLDHSVVSFAGGISLIEGGETYGFVPLQLQQALGRITNSRFEFNDSGQDGAGPSGRFGRLAAAPSTIFVRGAQPIIVGNTFVDNDGSNIDIDSDSLTAERRVDTGRQTGSIDRFAELDDNFGPLVRFNRYEDNDLPGLNQITGMEVRGGILTTESVWDDTDIVHLLFDTIEVGNFHSSGGLKLRSRPDESLVVKLIGSGTPNSSTIGTGFTATGTPDDAIDRIGGSISILGQPGAPVVLTSFLDDTVGAGLKPDGSQFTDNNGDGISSRPSPNDWRSVYLDQYSVDRNVAVIPEFELSTEVAPGLNGDVENAQFLGALASNLSASDEVLRLGFEVEGFLSGPTDVDTYSFTGKPGTEVWVDIDQTSFGLDTVIELLDENGQVLARSDNSSVEVANGSTVDVFDPRLDGVTTSLQARATEFSEFGVGGLYEDFGTTNVRDAGIHFVLTGNNADPNSRGTYFFRVRSGSVNPDDAAGGLTRGGYRFQVRLTENQEFPGSVVRYSDIRYANHGVHVSGLLGSSPFLGEAQENEATAGQAASNDRLDSPIVRVADTTPPGQRPQNLGNLTGNRADVISVGGSLDGFGDIDFYQFTVDFAGINGATRSTVFDIDYADGFNRPDTNISVFYDPDGEFNETLQPRLVLFGSASNIFDDQTSPNGENNELEKLLRGSIATGDPLIGPVTLPEGTYYVAVTADGLEPLELSRAEVRREPVNSVRRIVEDRIDNAPFGTANGPQISDLFAPADIAAAGFTTALDGLPGHGQPIHFDGSSTVAFAATGRFSETAVAFGDAPETFGLTVNADLSLLDYSVNDDSAIGGRFAFDPLSGAFISENTSTTIPHVTIQGTLRDLPGTGCIDCADFYEIVVSEDGSRVILDVDGAQNGLQGLDNDDDSTPFNPDFNAADTDLVVIRQDPGGLGWQFLGAGVGSSRFNNSNVSDGRLGSSSVDDPFFDQILAAGTYAVGVLHTSATFDLNNGFPVVGNPTTTMLTADYDLHVSIENQLLPPSASANSVLQFDRLNNFATGTLTSQPFDLVGYAASDLPTSYFNYRYDPVIGDTVSARIFSDQDMTGISLSGQLISNDIWNQIRTDLSAFAGHTGIRFEFTYNPSAQLASTEIGLMLDDFIVGFAERGETVFNTRGDEDRFVGFASGGTGEYQLEMRPGTEYATPSVFGGLQLNDDYDTNDRHSQSVTLYAPAGSQLSDGDTFVLGDGASNQVFEFTTTPGSVGFGNTAVLFSATDTPAQIAQAIRTALTQQTSIAIEAASSSGNDTGTLTDGRLALSGSARGTFLSIDSLGGAPDTSLPLSVDADGHLLMPAVLHNGMGDLNYERTQGQIFIDANTISDVRGIGIWSEPGVRDTDPEDQRYLQTGFFDPINVNSGTPNPFLELPPVGNTYPGGVRNLPTLNDSVLGGLTPGVVISNNTIDQAGYAGIKVDGETAPWEIDTEDLVNTLMDDGALLTIDAGGTRVVFEFEEINGAGPAFGGTNTPGGNGVADGNVPIYYREFTATVYNGRAFESSSHELSTAIAQAIQGSILVTNGLVELVDVSVGPSMYQRDNGLAFLGQGWMGSPDTAVYIQGASQIYYTPLRSSGISRITQVPVYEAPQPFARIVNNTIYGSDGRESLFPELPPATGTDSDDLIATAIDTNVGPSHRGPYVANAQIGDNAGPLGMGADVDFYRVELGLGDRLIVDIDTLDADPANGIVEGADTVVRIYNEQGVLQEFLDANGTLVTLSDQATAPNYLDPAFSAFNETIVDAVNTRDPFIDFTALAKGSYYVAVSSVGNSDYDPNALSGRTDVTVGTGDYTISMEAYAPRTHVIGVETGNATGARGTDVSGSIFRVTQIPDFGPNALVNNGFNYITYEILSGNAAPTVDANGNNIADLFITLNDNDHLPDIMREISGGINLAVVQGVTNTPLANHESLNGPGGISGPITRVRAQALGGIDGDNAGLNNLTRTGLPIRMVHRPSSATNGPTDFQRGFGHDRLTSGGNGTTEQYVFVENAAKIEILAGPLTLDPVAGRDTDQLINETGVMVAGGASPALLNNVFLNLHESVVVEETYNGGFNAGAPGFDNHVKPMEVVVVGNTFQHDEPLPTRIAVQVGAGITTGNNEPSNINGGADDFNQTALNNAVVLVNPQGDSFLPAPGSGVIDSAVNSLNERDAFANLKQSVGIPVSNILAPIRDVNGVLRADNPDFPNLGIGGIVFRDRGSTELADFVGPVAVAEVPRDNDAEGIDSDPTVSVINLSGGVYDEFRIQLRDNGDASDPFLGNSINDNTVVVPEIPGLRAAGANVTVFEDDQLLTEGIDYTFSYDETKNIITLTPLAGIWQSDRAYRIELNNADRTVLIAPDAREVIDGDQLEITDSAGGRVVFEFESGFQLRFPDPLTLTVPQVGTNQGGLIDGGIFQVNDGSGSPVVFEFNSDTAKLPDSVEVRLPAGNTPIDDADLAPFLNQIAQNIADAIDGEVQAGRLDLDVRVDGATVILGSERGATVDTVTSGLLQDVQSLAISVPAAGAGVGGVVAGQTFVLDNGTRAATFEIVDRNLPALGNIGIDIAQQIPGQFLTADEVARAIQTAIAQSPLGLSPTIEGTSVYLALPVNGSATAAPGPLSIVGLSRTPADGDAIQFTPADGSAQVIFELNRTDEPDVNGGTMDDGVAASNIAINFNRATTADELALLTQGAIRSRSIAGIDPNEVQTASGGILTVGGQQGLGLAVIGSSIDVVGSPDVTGPTTVEVFGPLLLKVPLVGGGGLNDGEQLTITDAGGNPFVFEFDSNGVVFTPGATAIPFNQFDDVDTLSTAIETAINAAPLGITATYLGNGDLSLGRIASDRVTSTSVLLTTERGIVFDQEILTIRQGNVVVNFEFDSVAGGGGVNQGNVPVPFQPGSTTGDVAVSLAAAIRNNLNGLVLSPVAELDDLGVPTGVVALNDLPGTAVNVTQAPTLLVSGVPGGAIPVRISPSFTTTEVKRALLAAIGRVNEGSDFPVSTLTARDRGGSTLFVENGAIFNGPVSNFFLPAIRDDQGNALEANREDATTQFTILMPTVSLDYGDAPDPVGGVPGRYPTLLEDNGARHVVGGTARLGATIDGESNALASVGAKGDDVTIDISGTGASFDARLDPVVDGRATIRIARNLNVPLLTDGDTVTVDLGATQATLELDLNGRFDEDNFAIRPQDFLANPSDPITIDAVAAAIVAAINESPLAPADVTIFGDTVIISSDDEDGVSFVSDVNPNGLLNKALTLPITVTGNGVLQGWIDYNADGDWDDPGEAILFYPSGSDRVADRASASTEVVLTSNNSSNPVTFYTFVPESTPEPLQTTTTYARFRISESGGLAPTGLALSGEVEDYALLTVPGRPPTLNDGNAIRSYTVEEDRVLNVLDVQGNLTPLTTNDDGLLAGVTDPDGQSVRVFSGDVGQQFIRDAAGNILADLNVAVDGTFTFDSVQDLNGPVTFSIRVTDTNPANPLTELVNSRPITVTVNITPANDKPLTSQQDVITTRTIDEDIVQIFTAQELILDQGYVPGPSNEVGQPLIFESGGSDIRGPFRTDQGGFLELVRASNFSYSDRTLTVPSGATLMDGQVIVVTGIDGEELVVEFSISGNPSTAADVVVPFTTADTAETIAARLGQELGVFDAGGVVAADKIIFRGITSLETESLAPTVVAGLTVRVPAGNTLQDGESVLLRTATGVIKLEFDSDGNSAGDSDVVVPFTTADTAETIAASAKALLDARGVRVRVPNNLNVAGDADRLVFYDVITAEVVSPVQTVAITPLGITVGAGISVADGETVLLTTPDGEVRVEFDSNAALTSNFNLRVPFTAADTAAEVTASLNNVLTNAGYRVEIAGAGDRLVFGVEPVDVQLELIRYTPPANFNGDQPDVFNYTVADVPPVGQISEVADKRGTVSITVNAVNDPPITLSDSYSAFENMPLTFPILTDITDGQGNVIQSAILSNDLPGPPDEVNAGQTISLFQPGVQFPATTFRGGSVSLENGALVYRPPGLYSGPDSFTYVVQDSEGATSTGQVFFNVGGTNDAPIFDGVNGMKVNGNPNDPVDTLVFQESKQDPEQTQYDLTTWFIDPENDAMTFTVTSSDPSILQVALAQETLSLTRQPFAFGDVNLIVTATDSTGLMTQQVISVTVENEEDAPSVRPGAPTVLTGTEDQVITTDLGAVFFDPDRTQLNYRVARIDSTVLSGSTQQINAQIALHPLLQSVTTVGNTLFVTPKANQFGTVEIEIAASDSLFTVTHTFTVTFTPVPDAPVALGDSYSIPIGSTLQILNPANGLLQNEVDPDGDSITVELIPGSGPTLGTLDLQADGTFVYTNVDGDVGDVDTFRYRPVDSTGLVGSEVVVSFTLTQSRYQNPIDNLRQDVNADGFITALDALRIINLLGREGSRNVPVSTLTTPPPDFYDTNGNGFVSAQDALDVINELAKRNGQGGREGEQVTASLLMATTTAIASPSNAFVPARNVESIFEQDSPDDELIVFNDGRDALLTAGLEINVAPANSVAETLQNDTGAVDDESVDEALTDLMDEMSVLGPYPF
ncbi:tandem-95 repeat protein [Stieleria varia]|uniref:Dockerin type I repeat protein n=1 Tax=Stieleria varia TaxID=2528005 RepID=A0A5C6B293_9BACT|nr:tandem-95 repeat protein [Stieleria varia]TWU06030.1 hypothetical protein Pla52n_17480 [Stieleria varia]